MNVQKRLFLKIVFGLIGNVSLVLVCVIMTLIALGMGNEQTSTSLTLIMSVVFFIFGMLGFLYFSIQSLKLFLDSVFYGLGGKTKTLVGKIEVIQKHNRFIGINFENSGRVLNCFLQIQRKRYSYYWPPANQYKSSDEISLQITPFSGIVLSIQKI